MSREPAPVPYAISTVCADILGLLRGTETRNLTHVRRTLTRPVPTVSAMEETNGVEKRAAEEAAGALERVLAERASETGDRARSQGSLVSRS
jgi:hypothetical protein